MHLSRRDLLIAGLGGAAALLAACGGAAAPTATSAPKAAEPTKPAPAPTTAATAAPTTAPTTAPAATTPAEATKPAAAATAPAAGATTTPAAAAKPAPTPTVVLTPIAGTLTIYSGRNQALVGPLLEQFAKETGIKAQTRYGDSAQLAATLLEEGKNSPADIFFSQDAGALGAVSDKGLLTKLPDPVLNRVDAAYRSTKGEWVALSARARVIAYNTKELKPEDLPDTVAGLTDPKWKDQLGWSPPNASFQAFVTALRLLEGEAAAKQWLQTVKANGAKAFPNNNLIVEGVGKGELKVGLVNHYYLYSYLKQQGESFPVRNYYPRGGGAGAIVNIAGAGILGTARNAEAAQKFVDYMLTTPAQQYFADQTFEYPMIAGVKTNDLLTPLAQLKKPDLDLSRLADLQATLALLRDVGLL
jgi:iron(III) transport system substrate-binding protein